MVFDLQSLWQGVLAFYLSLNVLGAALILYLHYEITTEPPKLGHFEPNA